MDYQGNSKKDKEAEEKKAEKKIEKVVSGEVIVVKRSLGRKIKDAISNADFQSVFSYVVHDVLLPSAKNMIVDAAGRGVERAVYGEAASRRGYRGIGGNGYSRIQYNTPVNRGYREPPPSRAPGGVVHGPRRQSQDDIILSDKGEAERVVEVLNDVIDQYDSVSVADLNDLLGQPTTHVMNKWGWTVLGNVPIRQLREGYLIDLPPAGPLP